MNAHLHTATHASTARTRTSWVATRALANHARNPSRSTNVRVSSVRLATTAPLRTSTDVRRAFASGLIHSSAPIRVHPIRSVLSALANTDRFSTTMDVVLVSV